MDLKNIVDREDFAKELGIELRELTNILYGKKVDSYYEKFYILECQYICDKLF